MTNAFQVQFSRTLLSTIFAVGFFVLQISAQNTVTAESILQRINAQEHVELEGVTITGDLDFTTLEKKFRGGSYGIRKGMVKEFFTKLSAPLVLRNCRIEGEIITYTETEKPGLVKHNFTAFDEKATFDNCTFAERVTFEKMTFYQGVEFRNCTFEERLKFRKVHFSKPPVFEGNELADKLVNVETNWTGTSGKLAEKPAGQERNSVTIVLKNSSLKDIDIRFGWTTWTLSPLGKSSLIADLGQEIYLWKNGSKSRRLITVTEDMEGQVFDVAKM